MNELEASLYQALCAKKYKEVISLIKTDNRILHILFTDREHKTTAQDQCLINFIELLNYQPLLINLVGAVELCKLATLTNKQVIETILATPFMQQTLATKNFLDLQLCHHALIYIVAICKNINADKVILARILNLPCFNKVDLGTIENLRNIVREIISAICNNPNVDKEILTIIFHMDFLQICNETNQAILAEEVIAHPKGRAELICEILFGRNSYLLTSYKLEIIAKHRYTSNEILWKILFASKYKRFLTTKVINCIAINKNANHEILEHILCSSKSKPNIKLLNAVAHNSGSSPIVLAKVWYLIETLFQGNLSVKQHNIKRNLILAIAANKNANEQILHRLLETNDQFVMQAVAAHPNTDKQILYKLSTTTDHQMVMQAIATNRNADQEILETLLENNDGSLFKFIAAHPNANQKIHVLTLMKMHDQMRNKTINIATILEIAVAMVGHRHTKGNILKFILSEIEAIHKKNNNLQNAIANMVKTIVHLIALHKNTTTAMLSQIISENYEDCIFPEIIVNIAKHRNTDDKILQKILYGYHKNYLDSGDIINISSDSNTNAKTLRYFFDKKYLSTWFGAFSLHATLDLLIVHRASSQTIMNVLHNRSMQEIEQHQLFVNSLKYKEDAHVESRFIFLKALPNSILSRSKFLYHFLDFIDLKDYNKNSVFFKKYDQYYLKKKSNSSGYAFQDVYELAPLAYLFDKVCNRIVNSRKDKSNNSNFIAQQLNPKKAIVWSKPYQPPYKRRLQLFQ